ncbi:hypothetical protein D3C81_1867800 [compost metagenome]
MRKREDKGKPGKINRAEKVEQYSSHYISGKSYRALLGLGVKMTIIGSFRIEEDEGVAEVRVRMMDYRAHKALFEV